MRERWFPVKPFVELLLQTQERIEQDQFNHSNRSGEEEECREQSGSATISYRTIDRIKVSSSIQY
jgi:hypothetical protein